MAFANAHGTNFYGGTKFTDKSDNFNIETLNIGETTDSGLLSLFAASSPGAQFDSREREPPARCHPGTREGILEQITVWTDGRDQADQEGERVLWLHGPAGAGKSAVAQTVAEGCAERGLLAASFFFCRGCAGRDSIDPLFSTIAYQLAVAIPQLRLTIQRSLNNDPSLVRKSISTQIQKLIVEPLQSILASSRGASLQPGVLPSIVIIDGLDECAVKRSQSEILDHILHLVSTPGFPLRFLITSRPVEDICRAFEDTDLSRFSSRRISLFGDFWSREQNIKSTHSQRGLRLLALDDGGIRGLSELIILEELMNRVRHLEGLDANPRPCDYFDLIGGVGTGGLIALMLGRLEMPIDAAIREYTNFTKHVFSDKKTGRTNEAFKATTFESAMKDIITSAGLPADCPIRAGQRRSSCLSFVSAVAAENMSGPRLFRSYDVRANQGYNCTIWEAARATTAAPKIFKAASIGDGDLKENFLGASLGFNNPVLLVLEEAETVFGPSQSVACMISIGAGHPGTISWQPSNTLSQVFSADLVDVLRSISTSCENTAEQLEKRYKHQPGMYYRLNVEQGLQKMALAEWKKLPHTKTHTLQYLQSVKTSEKLDAIAGALRSRPTNASVGELNGHR